MLEAVLIFSRPAAERWRSCKTCLCQAGFVDQKEDCRTQWSRYLGQRRQWALPFIQMLDIADEIVRDFRTTQNSGQASLDISAYDSPEATARLHDSVRALSGYSAQAKPTQFHCFLDRLAQSGRLLRHFTQNIDCIERNLSCLWEKTVQLHGRIDQAKCHLCSWNGALVPQWFCGPGLQSCPRCEQVAIDREQAGKRRRIVGGLRPNVVLYGEENPAGNTIGKIAERDLRTGSQATERSLRLHLFRLHLFRLRLLRLHLLRLHLLHGCLSSGVQPRRANFDEQGDSVQAN